MTTFQKFYQFVEDKAHGVHNLSVGGHTLKVALSNVSPVVTDSVLADITEIAAGNGYTAGGETITVSSSAQTSGVYKLVLADVVFTSASAGMADFRYAIVYNATATDGPLIGFFDYGSTVSLPVGETFTVDFDATTGAITDV